MLTSAVTEDKSPFYNRGEIDLQFTKGLFLQDFNSWGWNLVGDYDEILGCRVKNQPFKNQEGTIYIITAV